MVRLTKGQTVRTEWNGKWWVLPKDTALIHCTFISHMINEDKWECLHGFNLTKSFYMLSLKVTEKYTFEHWHLVIWMTKFKITRWYLVHVHFWPTCRFMNLLNLPHLIILIQQLQIQLEFLNFMAKIINLNLLGPGSIPAYGTIFKKNLTVF